MKSRHTFPRKRLCTITRANISVAVAALQKEKPAGYKPTPETVTRHLIGYIPQIRHLGRTAKLMYGKLVGRGIPDIRQLLW